MFRWYKLIPKGAYVEVQTSGPKVPWSTEKRQYRNRGEKAFHLGKYRIVWGRPRMSQK
jgi:hypothetical protein